MSSWIDDDRSESYPVTAGSIVMALGVVALFVYLIVEAVQ